MDDIIWYLESKKRERKNLVRHFADNLLRLKGEDFTAMLDLLAEEQGIGTTAAYSRLLADATIGKYCYIPQY